MSYEGDNMMGVKRNNRSAALRILHRQGSMSRKRLSEAIKLTPASITKIVSEMLAEGLLIEGAAVPSEGAGRREILLQLNPQAGCALGVLINLRQAILSAVWLDGSVIFSEQIALPPKADAEEWVPKLAGRLMALVEANEVPRDKLIGLGIAVRGICSPDERGVYDSFGALQQSNVALCSRFEALTGLPTVLANNVRALFAAELFFSHEAQTDSALFVRCASGIGSALSVRGQILSGSRGQCGEIGHIPVIRQGGKPCHCGKSGCLETIASPAAIVTEAQERFGAAQTPLLFAKRGSREAVTLYDVLDAAQGGDRGAAEVSDRAAQALANALKGTVYLIDPERIVLYGPLFDHPYFLSRLKAEMAVGVDAAHAVPMEKSRFNNILENKAAGLLAVAQFLENGGFVE